MQHSFEERFEQAMQLRQESKHQAARDKFIELLREQPCSKIVLGMLSVCYFELEEHELAVVYATQSVAVSPKSERASLVLFHSLWKTNREDEAFEEMRRFLALTPSDAYDELLKDINESSY